MLVVAAFRPSQWLSQSLGRSQPSKCRGPQRLETREVTGGPPSIRAVGPKNDSPHHHHTTSNFLPSTTSHQLTTTNPNSSALYQKNHSPSKWVRNPIQLICCILPFHSQHPAPSLPDPSIAYGLWLMAGSWRGFTVHNLPRIPEFSQSFRPSVSLTSTTSGPDHTCSCGASCQCPAGACQCPVSNTPVSLHPSLYRTSLSNHPVG
jgi:hypothetical protein